MITQNSGLRRYGIHNFSIPALATKLPDGRNVLTCPSAGVCANVCYARFGTYQFPAVKAKHQRNLARFLDDPQQWETDLIAELAAPKYRGGKLRVHDSGDYFSDDYLAAWLRVARGVPDVLFYSYTKEVSRFRRLVEPDPPANFAWVYSYGGKEDHLLDPATDRVADVFPDEAAITAAGWHTNANSDLDAVLGPSPVGMTQNNIPHLRKAIGSRTFREWQTTKRTRGRDVSRNTAHN
ncbi:hypothetical protein FXN61_00840 [Lentzea sp. PSKA42]|uniref:Gene product 88 domain-containing protein n=1 Tax=Lentzea indica TaxID=2604800 RepID=A0ABX1F971_9PSEU|nr:hypothetical protein [Lentzea indica]NKE55448.1 hypothetical protein [Lentzea indica]